MLAIRSPSRAVRARRGARNGQHPVSESWRRRESRDLEDFPLVEGLAREQGVGQRIQLRAMRAEEMPGLLVTVGGDPGSCAGRR